MHVQRKRGRDEDPDLLTVYQETVIERQVKRKGVKIAMY